MSIQASDLKINPNKIKYAMKEVRIILRMIDDDIKIAYDRGECRVSVPVPITFAIPHMSNKDAQRIIYYKILESLIDRGYIVKIGLTLKRTVFLIKWLTENEEHDVELQNTLLRKHQIPIPDDSTETEGS